MKENLAALQKAFINLATERSQLMHYIEVENLTFYYDDEPVLEDVSYYVDPGEFVILTGENGAAKSTLIKSTLGLLKPTSGKITVAKKSAGEKSVLATFHNKSLLSMRAFLAPSLN